MDTGIFPLARKHKAFFNAGADAILRREKVKEGGKTYYFYPDLDLYFDIKKDRFDIVIEHNGIIYHVFGIYEIIYSEDGTHSADSKNKVVSKKSIRFLDDRNEEFREIIFSILSTHYNKNLSS